MQEKELKAVSRIMVPVQVQAAVMKVVQKTVV
jgi:hypothetical protein